MQFKTSRFIISIKTILYLIAFVLSWVFLAIILKRFDSKIGLELPAIIRPVGLFIVVVGTIIGLSCVFIFVTHGQGTPVPFDPPQKFVATGLYRYVRNPMFIGAFLALLGFGMFLLSVSVLILAIVAILLAHCFVVLVEEPGLERRFGESYRCYKKSVSRWLPKLSNRVGN